MNNIYETTYEAALAELQLENDRLKAHIERLNSIRKEWKGLAINDAKTLVAFIELANSTPAQSLNHIRAQVEDETIEYDAKLMDADMNYYAASRIRGRVRKYKEQSDED